MLNYQVFLDNGKIASSGISRTDIIASITAELKNGPAISYAIDEEKVQEATIPNLIKEKIINGYSRGRSGDVQIVMHPGWYASADSKGTEHGVWNPYDTTSP